MKPGGEFRFATDDPTYLNWALMIMQRHTDEFEWVVKEPGDWLSYPNRDVPTVVLIWEGVPGHRFSAPAGWDPIVQEGRLRIYRKPQ